METPFCGSEAKTGAERSARKLGPILTAPDIRNSLGTPCSCDSLMPPRTPTPPKTLKGHTSLYVNSDQPSVESTETTKSGGGMPSAGHLIVLCL